MDVKQSLNAADLVAPDVVFDIGGNAGEEYDRMVAAVERLMNQGEDKYCWKPSRSSSRLTMIDRVRCLRLPPTKCSLTY